MESGLRNLQKMGTPDRKSTRIPKLCRHKPSNRGYVTDPRDGKMIYLGRFGAPETMRAYSDWIAQFAKDIGHIPATGKAPKYLGELLTHWLKDVEQKCRRADGSLTGEWPPCKRVHALAGECGIEMVPVRDLNRNHLVTVRDYLLGQGLAKKTIDGYVSRLIRALSWAEKRDWVDFGQLARLQRWERLRPGDAPASKKVEPIPDRDLKRIYLRLPARWRPIFILQLYTGMRVENALRMRADEVDTSVKPWRFRPVQHKNRHRGDELEILLGPIARAAIKPYLKSAEGKLSLWRKKRDIMHQTWRTAFRRACAAARVPDYTPRQLRHTAASFLVNQGVPEAVIGAILGHKAATITQRYTKVSDRKKAEIVEKWG